MSGDDVTREQMRRELRRQPRWLFWVVLVSTGLTLASTLMGDPDHGFGGPVLRLVVMCGSGLLLVLCIVLILLRGGTRAEDH
jgi:peptidoglycan/LPS O-acetylase OafA/YrhL